MSQLLNLEIEKYNLENGLEVILYQQNSSPLTSVNLLYKVGSANEITGKTGLAHLFEHMMFQGSENVEKEMHFKYIQEAGGLINAFTSSDKTIYYETVPSKFLELVLWLESDRMGYFLPALTETKLENQRDVVFNERLERYDNQPYGLAWEIIFKNMFKIGHPYYHPTIGFQEDIKAYSLDDVRNFFKKYYSPSNATLVISGSFEKNLAKDMIAKYFSDISGNGVIPFISADSSSFIENITIIHKDNVEVPRIYFSWHSDKIYNHHDTAMDMVAELFAGEKNSILYKKLVHEKKLAAFVQSFQYSGFYAGLFILIVVPNAGVEFSEIEKIINEEINSIVDKGFDEEDVAISVSSVTSDFIFSLEKITKVSELINSYNFNVGEPNYFLNELNRYKSLNNEKLIEAVKTYLTKPYLKLEIIPKNENK